MSFLFNILKKQFSSIKLNIAFNPCNTLGNSAVFLRVKDKNILTFLLQTNGDTPLHAAVKNQDLSMVRLLLDRRDIDPNAINEVWQTVLDIIIILC